MQSIKPRGVGYDLRHSRKAKVFAVLPAVKQNGQNEEMRGTIKNCHW
jgi:hypothetical protein